MTWYVTRRLMWGALLLLAVSFLTFLVFFALPFGDPAQLRAGKNASPEMIEEIRHTLWLDRSVPEQFVHYLDRVFLHADFGFSYTSNADVLSGILSRLPGTASIVIGGAMLWMLIGLPIGIYAALRPGSLTDRVLMGSSLVAFSLPTYWLGLLALTLFANDIGVFKLLPGSNSYQPIENDPGAWLGAMILPWAVLAIAMAGGYARIMRSSLATVLDEDYIETAVAKGQRRSVVVLRHGVRAAITPVVTAFGMDLGFMLGGVVLLEQVFGVPGIGKWAIDSIGNQDLPVIQGTVMFGALFIIIANIVVDIFYAVLDPRVRVA